MDPAADLSSFCRKEYWLLKTSFGNGCLYWASSLTFGIPYTLQDLLQYKNEFKGVYIYFFFQLLLLTTFYHSWLWCKDDLIVKYLLGYICQKKVPIPVKYHSKRHTVIQSIKFLSFRENVIAMQFSRTMKVREKRITFQQTKLMPTKLFLLQCFQL